MSESRHCLGARERKATTTAGPDVSGLDNARWTKSTTEWIPRDAKRSQGR